VNVRTVAEYMAKAAAFDALAVRVENPVPLRNRYADLADCYRLLAKERERMLALAAVESDDPEPTASPRR